jgi:hypothetical protein
VGSDSAWDPREICLPAEPSAPSQYAIALKIANESKVWATLCRKNFIILSNQTGISFLASKTAP